MKLSFQRRLLLLFLIIMAGIVIAGVVTYRNNSALQEINRLVKHTQNVLYETEQVLSITKDIGGGGYILTGDSNYLEHFTTAKSIIFTHVAKLKELTKDDVSQQSRIEFLSKLLDMRVSFSQHLIELRREVGFEQARKLIATGQSKDYMDQIRHVIATIQQAENDLLLDREKENANNEVAFNRAFYSLLSSIAIMMVVIFIVIRRNVIKIKTAEEDIRKANYFLDTILENIPNMIFVKDAGELRFVRFNKAGEDLLGYSRKDLIGKNDYDFFPKEQADFFTSNDRDVLNRGVLADIAEEPIQTKHGQRFLHTKKIPIINEEGLPAYLLGISEDITERKRAEEMLRESNEQFLKLFYSNPTAMCINTVEEGRFIDANESFENLIGFKKKEMIGKTSVELGIVSEQSHTPVVESVNQHGSVRNVEQTINNNSGKRVSVLLSVEKIKLKNSDCFISAIVDITERKKAEEKIKHLNMDLEKTVAQLQDLNKELESFTYSVSHDLRSPLRIIDGYADILYNDYKTVLDEDGKKSLGVIKSNARRMGQLIDDLLNLSRLGKRDLTIQNVNMDELAEVVLKEQLAAAADQKVELKKGRLLPVAADSGIMRQVWTNYISNALKYSGNKEKSLIEIGSYKEGKNNVYFVKDNGVGFDMKYADKLFGIFQRLHRMDEFEGTGVGLAIVQRVVSRHGGKVWAEARPDEGATFYFSLPA